MLKSEITEENLLSKIESISEELRQCSIKDPNIKQYKIEMAGLEDDRPFFMVPAFFIYIISSS